MEEYIVERKEVDKKSWRQIVTSSQTSVEVRSVIKRLAREKKSIRGLVLNN